ncbi:ABC transporter permease [Fulvivirgaceae bacterium BMA10]|uniref:ABC transporter permease n=1 Tax=Splendidivirga corallicola TaxID=3051826 RepID=A0ABT8KP24_9BACT|nr:ABC transporter permease [Fulvivirgaceae bacterium BMA10]
MKLKDQQIEFIERDLRARGVSYEPLLEDVLDHICSEVEMKINNGARFMDAYQAVVMKFEKRGFVQLNQETTNILNPTTMLKNYWLIALRSLMRSKWYNAMKISGLAIGITCFLLTWLYFQFEFSYDQFHNNADHIYRLGRVGKTNKVGVTAFPLVPALKQEYPDYLFTRFFKDRSKTLFKNGDKTFMEENMIWADKDFLKVFTFRDFTGNEETALREPFSVILTQSAAQKYFDDTPEPGTVIELRWNGAYYPLKITGIIPEWPDNMHIDFDIIISFETGMQVFPGGITDSWTMNYCYSYVKLPVNTLASDFESTFEDFVNKYVQHDHSAYQSYLGFMQPVRDIHLDQDVIANYTKTTNPNYPKIALAIGLLVLIITVANYVTLTLAQFQDKAKEIGIRGVIGATKKQLLFQFGLEACISVVISVALAVVLLHYTLDPFNVFLNTHLTLDELWFSQIIYLLPLFIFLITFIVTTFPSMIFWGRNMVDIIDFKHQKRGTTLRRILMVFQFFIASCLLISSIVTYDQMNYIRDKALGYEKDQILLIPRGRLIRYDTQPFKTAALASPGVKSVSLSMYKPTDYVGNMIDVQTASGEPSKIATAAVDHDFFTTYEVPFIAGRDFSDEIATDQKQAYIVNESALTLLNIDEPIGHRLAVEFKTGDPGQPVENREGEIIGVVKDVHFESLHHNIKPMMFIIKPYWYFYISCKLDAQRTTEAINHLEQSWEKLFPDEPFEYSFLDDQFALTYQTEQRLGQGLMIITILAIFMAALGLFGYAQFIMRQRIKEISVRKVLGARVWNITMLLSKEFLISIFIASVASFPLTYYLAEKWLEDFAYKTSLSWVIFSIALLILLLVTSLTICQQIVRIVMIQPSKTLRYE